MRFIAYILATASLFVNSFLFLPNIIIQYLVGIKLPFKGVDKRVLCAIIYIERVLPIDGLPRTKDRYLLMQATVTVGSSGGHFLSLWLITSLITAIITMQKAKSSVYVTISIPPSAIRPMGNEANRLPCVS